MKIEVKSIKKTYGKNNVLNDVCFYAESGQCVGIVGANGSGKTTLLSILAGVQTCDSGEFVVDGHNLFRDKSRHTAAVGYVPQGIALFEELTARDNLLLWYDRKSLKQELSTGVLKLLGIDQFERKQVRKLSGGMKKRVTIGCAMAKKPPVLLLDEPMAALDYPCRLLISSYLQQYQNAGGIVIIVSHDLQEIALCDHVYVIRNGILEAVSDKERMKDILCNL